MEETDAPVVTVRSAGIRYGLISAGIGIVFFLVLALTGMGPFDNKWGWVRLVIGIVLMVMAHKYFKDNGDGFMSYGQGFSVGFWMMIVSVALGGVFTWLYVSFIDSGPLDMFYETQLQEMQEKGMPDDQIEVAQTWTRKLWWPIFIVFSLIMSVVFPAIITIFTQKKNQQAEMM